MNRRALAATKRGAKFLDKQLGRGWRRKIRRRKLDLASECNCIVGQLRDGRYEPSSLGVDTFRQEVRLGFEVGHEDSYGYADLTDAWLKILREKPKVSA